MQTLLNIKTLASTRENSPEQDVFQTRKRTDKEVGNTIKDLYTYD